MTGVQLRHGAGPLQPSRRRRQVHPGPPTDALRPDDNRVLIDSTDIRHRTLASVRSRVGPVAQHVLPLTGAVVENIAYDEPAVARDRIEATAMFDPAGEEAFIAECHELLHQRTVILITHRPASLALADRVLKLETGERADAV